MIFHRRKNEATDALVDETFLRKFYDYLGHRNNSSPISFPARCKIGSSLLGKLDSALCSLSLSFFFRANFTYAELRTWRMFGRDYVGRKENVEGVLFRNEASREIFGWDNGELVNPADLSRLDFQRDVRILAALEDRNIARVLGACYREEPYCVVMEYLEHGDLCQFLKTHITAEDAHSMPIGVKTLR